MKKYMFLYRRPEASLSYQPSPEEMQAMYKSWAEWKATFKDNILEMGDGLTAGGRVLSEKGEVTDGPFVEAKEVLGGFSIVQAKDYNQALEVARACPVREIPGNSVEIREMAGFD